MFRYVAIVCEASQEAAASFADQLGQRWLQQVGWSATLQRPGLHIFVHGETPGVNQAQVLPGGQGVVLGKVFRRLDLNAAASPANPSIGITAQEGARILDDAGQSLIGDFWGRYVAFLQSREGSTCAIRDPSGTLPCHMIRMDQVAIVFSWLEDVLRLLPPRTWTPTVNQDALAHHLLHGAATGRESCLEGVLHLMPGERIDLYSGVRTTLWCGASFARSVLKVQPDEAAQRLRDQVRACTSAWAGCYDTLLMRLSGGVDSSILLSCLGPTRASADVIGINYYSQGADSDERHYARLAALRVGRDLLEQERDPTFPIDRVLRMAGMPDPQPYVGFLNAGTDARLAASYGARAMFTGAGGDSLFYEFPRWWSAADYLHDEGLNAGFLSAAMDAARLGRLSLWRTIALALTQQTGPSSAEEVSTGQGALLSADLRDPQLSSLRFVHPVVQQAHGLPLGKYMQTIALLYPIGYYDPFEQEAAPEFVNPLLSQPLVELCLRLPTYQLIQGGRGRALARRAFADDLPAQVINRRTKGGMEGHVKAVLLANIDLIRELLLDGQLAGRRLIERAKVEELLSGRPTTLNSAVGRIHALVAVEAWLMRWIT